MSSDAEKQLKTFKKELEKARDLNELKKVIHTLVQPLGFTDFVFMRMERNWQTGAQYGLLHSLPDELMRVYHKQAMYQSDMLIEHGKSSMQPIFSSQVYGYLNRAPFETHLTIANRELLQLYQRFHYFNHYVIPMPASNGNGNVQLLLTTQHCEVNSFYDVTTPVMSVSRVLCQAIDVVSTQQFRSAFIETGDKPVSLTVKQRQLLQELANRDASIKTIAKALSLSDVTAHQHVSAARKALGVGSNIAAVVKALRMGLITLPPED